MTASVEAFLTGFSRLLTKEREADVERTALLFTNCSKRLLENKGLALGSLSVASISVGLGGKSLIELERPLAYHVSQSFPPHTFRPGDLAQIEESSKQDKSARRKMVEDEGGKFVDGIVYRVSDTRIVLSVDSIDGIDLPERCRLLKLANTVTYDRMDGVIKTLKAMFLPGSGSPVSKGLPEVKEMHRVLLGLQPLGQPDPSIAVSLRWFDDSLNDSQQKAVKFALESANVACIWGPPGTGKTHTLIELILQLVSRKLRVLVCGASNLSVDNILERLVSLPRKVLMSLVPEMHLLRLSHPARTLSHLVRATLDFQSKNSEGGALTRDCKKELEEKISLLTSRKGGGIKAKAGRARLTKEERRRGWEEVRDLRKEYRRRESQVITEVVGKANVVLSTCHSAGSKHISGERFDVLIIDEVTQAMEPVCWIPILKANKLVLAGDPLQLPPTVLSDGPHLDSKKVKGVVKTSVPRRSSNDSESSSEDSLQSKSRSRELALSLVPPCSLSTTLFERLVGLHGNSVRALLQTQYRMNSRISAFPSIELYNAALVDHSSVRDHLLDDLVNRGPHAVSREDPDRNEITAASEILREPLVFFDTSGHNFFEKTGAEGIEGEEGSKCNENEASIAVKWVSKLVDGGIGPHQMAIITPYQAQVQLLSSLLRSKYPDIEIGSVDGMQGREQEVVILSLVRSNDRHEVGFLKDKRRLNVAMTRARRQLCVIGDSHTIKSGSKYLAHWMDWLEAEAEMHFPDEMD